MGIIEQAARRLEELRRSGIEAPSRLHFMPAAGAAADHPVVRNLPPAPPASRKVSRAVQVDLARLAAMGYLTPETPRARIADEFRVVKRPLLDNIHRKAPAAVDRANLIMVTSSVPGEGKTFVSLNLAISLAMELDTTVLLVDADVARPSVLDRLGLPPTLGLLDVLVNPSLDLADVLMRTNIDKLSILPAGKPQGRSTELLAGDGMNRLLDELATRYPDRVLVFDTPPLLASTESRALATHMGQVVMVVESGGTPHKTVMQALDTIEILPGGDVAAEQDQAIGGRFLLWLLRVA